MPDDPAGTTAVAYGVCGIPIYEDRGVRYMRRDEIRQKLSPHDWQAFTDWYGVRSGHPDGPFPHDVAAWYRSCHPDYG